jgi:hypothetical protein
MIHLDVPGGDVTARDVYLKGWSGLTKVELVHQALGGLQEGGWTRELPLLLGKQGGRPTGVYDVNPAVHHE